jgi:4-hydroxy-3-polyprenylbenzoate decarboxylase
MTGASGAAMTARLLQELRPHEVHLVMTRAARTVARQELVDGGALKATHTYSAEDDIAAPLASSSCLWDAMIVVPCSVKTLAAVAHSYASNLVVRAADIALRTRRPLILVVRETPLSLPTIENMRAVSLAGATILPPSMAYYFRPESVGDMTDFLVGKIMDLLGLPHSLYRRWSGPEEPVHPHSRES